MTEYTHTHTHLFYNVVLVSVLQQSGSAIRIYMIYYFIFNLGNIFLVLLNSFETSIMLFVSVCVCVAVKSFIFKMLRFISEFLLSS